MGTEAGNQRCSQWLFNQGRLYIWGSQANWGQLYYFLKSKVKQTLSGKSSLILWLLDRKEFQLDYPGKNKEQKMYCQVFNYLNKYLWVFYLAMATFRFPALVCEASQFIAELYYYIIYI